MIIYLPSYLRFGNSLTQLTISTYFDGLITALNPKSEKAEYYAEGKACFIKNWRYNSQYLSDNKTIWHIALAKLNDRIFKIYNLNDWIALYDLNVPPYLINSRY